MSSAKDLTQQRFGRLVAISKVGVKGTSTLWLCQCDCGNTTIVRVNELTCGKTVSCGCYARELSKSRMEKQLRDMGKTVHGYSRTRLYGIWKGMRKRCYSPSNANYKNYGGRGISICEEWQTFPPFRDWAMANGYDPDAPKGVCTIDRIDVNGNYEPSNCRWTDAKTQNNNRRKPKPTLKKNRKPVQMLAEDGTVITTFTSLNEAAVHINGFGSNIRVACNNPSRTAYGHHWQFCS